AFSPCRPGPVLPRPAGLRCTHERTPVMTTERGFCVWLTGLSGAGKSTIAAALKQKLDAPGREVVVLYGDAVRARVKTPLGFSREDRSANVRHVAEAAVTVVETAGIAICA